MSVKERVILFLEYLEMSQAAFEKECGLSNGAVNNIRVSIGTKNLQRIVLKYPELNTVWLLMGVGEMLLKNEENVSTVNDHAPKYHTKKQEISYEELQEIVHLQTELVKELRERVKFQAEMITELLTKIK